MLKGLVVDEVMVSGGSRSANGDGTWNFDYRIREDLELSKEDTYMLIFSPGTFNALDEFKKQFKGKILFEGKKAYNTTHPGSPRNTLVIFETSDD